MLPHYGLTWLEDRNLNIGRVFLSPKWPLMYKMGGNCSDAKDQGGALWVR